MNIFRIDRMKIEAAQVILGSFFYVEPYKLGLCIRKNIHCLIRFRSRKKSGVKIESFIINQVIGT